MRVQIDATQEEFDAKRPELIKALAGSRFEVLLKSELKEEPPYKAQVQMLDYWDAKFRTMLNDINKDLLEIIG